MKRTSLRSMKPAILSLAQRTKDVNECQSVTRFCKRTLLQRPTVFWTFILIHAQIASLWLAMTHAARWNLRHCEAWSSLWICIAYWLCMKCVVCNASCFKDIFPLQFPNLFWTILLMHPQIASLWLAMTHAARWNLRHCEAWNPPSFVLPIGLRMLMNASRWLDSANVPCSKALGYFELSSCACTDCFALARNDACCTMNRTSLRGTKQSVDLHLILVMHEVCCMQCLLL